MVNSIALPRLPTSRVFLAVTRVLDALSANRAQKSQNFSRRHDLPPQPGARADRDRDRPVRRPARRSCSRNLVLRLLARAAGGAVAPDGILALLGFNALFYLNILLSVALFLTVLLTLTRWYRDSEMIVWFTSGQSLDRVPEADPAVRGAVPGRDRRAVAVPVAVGRAAQARVRATARVARRALDPARPGLFREFKRANLVVFVESINTFDGTIRNVFLQSIDDGKDATTVARIARLEEGAQRRPLHRARGRPALRRQARQSPTTGSSSSRSSGGASSPPRRARCRRRRKAIPTGDAARRATARSSAPSCSGACRCRSSRSC